MIDHDGQSSLASFKDLIPWFFGRSLLLSLPVIEAAQIRLIAHRLGALGAPEGTRFGTLSVLTGIKKNATDVMDE